jgi:hypothetical protein
MNTLFILRCLPTIMSYIPMSSSSLVSAGSFDTCVHGFGLDRLSCILHYAQSRSEHALGYAVVASNAKDQMRQNISPFMVYEMSQRFMIDMVITVMESWAEPGLRRHFRALKQRLTY